MSSKPLLLLVPLIYQSSKTYVTMVTYRVRGFISIHYMLYTGSRQCIYCHIPGFEYKSAQDVFNEVCGLSPIYAGLDWDRIENAEYQWPVPEKDHPGTPILHEGEFKNGRGIFKMIRPREVGGYEADPVTQHEVIARLSQHDPSTGWVAFIGAGSIRFAGGDGEVARLADVPCSRRSRNRPGACSRCPP